MLKYVDIAYEQYSYIDCSTCLIWHGYYTKFHDDRFRHSSNIKVITTKMLNDVIMALLIGGICEVRSLDGERGRVVG
jgi:hypothetical protein